MLKKRRLYLGQTRTIRVATINLLNDSANRAERLDLVVSEIKKLKPDVVFLQELNLQQDFPAKLSKKLPKYHLSLSPRSDKYTGQEALGILSLIKPTAVESLNLSQGRVAQKIVLNYFDKKIAFVNVHLYFSPLRDAPRQAQIKQLLKFAERPAIIAGDFNARYSATSLKILGDRFNSAYQEVHSHAPQWTSPTPLWRGPGIRHSLRRQGLKLAGLVLRGPLGSLHGAIDHIFVDSDLKVITCELCFDKPAKNNPQLYASDHYGLLADVALRNQKPN